MANATRNYANSEALKALIEPFTQLPFDGSESEATEKWFLLALKLGIDPCSIEALVAAVRSGGWRKQKAPREWLRRQAAEARDPALQDPFVYMGKDDEGIHVWKRRFVPNTLCFSQLAGDDYDQDTVADFKPQGSQNSVETKRDIAEAKLTAEFRKLRCGSANDDDMRRLDDALDAIGADEYERQVVRSRVPRVVRMTRGEFRAKYPGSEDPISPFASVHYARMPRKELLAGATSEKERKALQAVWKRIERNGFMPKLRKELRSRAAKLALKRADRRDSWEFDFDVEDHGRHTKAHLLYQQDQSNGVRRDYRNAIYRDDNPGGDWGQLPSTQDGDDT